MGGGNEFTMKIPDYLIESTLEDLLPNERVYTVPWAMYADRDGQLWLNGNYSFFNECGGNAKMGVERVNGGYKVDLSLCPDARFLPGNPCYMGDFTPLEVVELR